MDIVLNPQERRRQPGPVQDLKDKVLRTTGQEEEEQPSVSVEGKPSTSIFMSATEEGPREVLVNYLPQDEFLPERPRTVVITKPGSLENDRFKVSINTKNFPAPKADEAGNFLYPPNDPRFAAGQAFATCNATLESAERFLGREIPWGHRRDTDKDRIVIHPHVGEGLNAFYNGETGSLNFMFGEDAVTGGVVESAKSADVGAHEMGHVILDGLRPRYLEAVDVPTGGFHEAFGDMVALIQALSDDAVVEAALAETSGDLARPNLLSRTGEQLGMAIYGEERPYIRDAFNDQRFKDQYFLPFIKIPNGQSMEAHQYSELGSGAFYELFVGLYEEARARNPNAPLKEAVAQAREVAGSLLYRAVEMAPPGKIDYKGFARALWEADRIDFGGAHLERIAGVFVRRNVLGAADIARLANETRPELQLPQDFTPDDAQRFLEDNCDKLKVEVDGLKFARHITNQKGETFLIYETERKVTLSGPEWGADFDGANFKLYGGLLLGFDSQGQLMTMNHDPITEDNVERSTHYLRKMVDFQQNPPIIIRGDRSEAPRGYGKAPSGKQRSVDTMTDFILAGVADRVTVQNHEIKMRPVVYCGEDHGHIHDH